MSLARWYTIERCAREYGSSSVSDSRKYWQILADFRPDLLEQEPDVRHDRVVAPDRLAGLRDVAQSDQRERARDPRHHPIDRAVAQDRHGARAEEQHQRDDERKIAGRNQRCCHWGNPPVPHATALGILHFRDEPEQAR
jgi:hypothetical protein